MAAPGIETVYCSSGCGQPIQRYAEEVKKPFGDDAECGPQIDLYSFNARRTDISCIVQRSIVLVVFEKHIFCCECNSGHL